MAVLAATFAPIYANADVTAPTPSFYTDFSKMGEHADALRNGPHMVTGKSLCNSGRTCSETMATGPITDL